MATAPISTSRYVSRAIQYANDCISGAQVSGQWTKKACRRFLRDLKAHKGKSSRFRFDESAADYVCEFVENLPHIKGPRAGDLFRLEDFQCFLVCNLFGWVNRSTGKRRFKRCYIEMARGNGKSFLLAAISLYMLLADGESGAEVYSAATTRDQARMVFDTAQEIVKRSPDLRAALGAQSLAHAIVQSRSASAFRALSAEGNTLDGLNVHFVAIDELHAHKTRVVYDVLETAIGKRAQPMLAAITTAGSDRTGICYETRNDLCKVLDEQYEDDSFFGVIYTCDEEDDWRDESIWPKANPNLGISVNLETLRDLAKKAERTPAAQAAFKTKHLDVWVGANAALYNVEDWTACADPSLSPEQFTGEPCIVAMDLASKEDLTATTRLFFRADEDERQHVYVFNRHYLPADTAREGRNDNFAPWAEQGYIQLTPGNTIDQAQIESDILEDTTNFQIDTVAFDPWQAQYLATRLADQGATTLQIGATVANFSEATKMLGALMKERRIHHNGDPVLAWAIGNVVGHYDAKDNVYPRKERPENKIDPAISLIMALSVWLRREDPYTLNDALAEEGLMIL